MSLSSLALGLHIATIVAPHIPLKSARPHPFALHTLSVLSIASYVLTIPLYFVVSHTYRPDATSALLFAFPGAVSQHFLATILNPRYPPFPLGTLTANIFATLLIGAFHTLQRNSPTSAPVVCELLRGLEDGYCGCLSTVSSFAVEVRGLKRRAWTYITVSILVAQIALVIVVGIPWWSGVVRERNMCSFR